MSPQSRKLACLFPAFAMRYKDSGRSSGFQPDAIRSSGFQPDTENCHPEPDLLGYDDEVAGFLAQASRVVEIDPGKFQQHGELVLGDGLQDDLQEQYACYVDSCAVGSLLKKRHIDCDYVAGYSMGLFAALYHSGAVSFADGLRLTHTTSTLAHQAVDDGQYGMGVVVGLTADQVGRLIAQHCPQVEVADVCGPHVVIASGRRSDLERLLEVCLSDGSLHARLLPVTIPFHCSLLRGVEGRMRGFIRQIQIRPPTCGVVSCVNQQVLSTEEDVREEAVANVWHPIRWFQTMRRLLELGVGVFVECGLSDRLCELARNLEGDYQIYHPRKFDRLFASLRG
jgi:[acyl-carrier-protein] S-malonyltransferase